MPTDLDRWLAGDTTYQDQLAKYNKTKADYNTQYTRQRGITERDYAETERGLNRQGQQDRLDQQNDFAGRGILHSGVFAKSLGDYNTDFNTKLKNLLTGRQDKLDELDTGNTNFLRQLQLEMDTARQDALRRRAARLGI